MNEFATRGLIEPEDLSELLGTQHVKILDATYGPLMASGRSIAGARIFDIDEIADHSNPLPHMLPSADQFAAQIGDMGIGNDDFVVVYDQYNISMAAARAWWMFRVFGHDNVAVLNGGLPWWESTGHAVTELIPPSSTAPKKFRPNFRSHLVADTKRVSESVEDKNCTIIDARSAERFYGRAHEPRPGMASGHIPGSLNLPYAALIDPATGRLKDDESLKRLLPSMKQNIIASCGSGVTACIIALSIFRILKQDVFVYDGSWAEWGLVSPDPTRTRQQGTS